MSGKWRSKEVLQVARAVALAELRTGAEAILTAAINEAPVDTGTLRRSGTVTVGGLPDGAAVYAAAEGGQGMAGAHSEPQGNEQAVYISFNTPYARRQHEELDWQHPRGGKAKYLEDPFNALKGKVLRRVERRVKRALQDKQ